ncbi:hypothetical protein EYF88_10720 [Paracoccus sediminis]|uniref:Uncharacterized protein n=2 Tax=Paracoccus sediminis TaxID=1214787 RepID=A0A238WXJ6_9RHOB|nr:hypothetical protein EYF88_10720 [Paracoccus sediminis]SNR50934.1 hypothetical protein SAMN06265378_106158 [Paracoccus sediminis]
MRKARVVQGLECETGQEIHRYDTAGSASILASRTVAEARGLTARSLGSLINHDGANTLSLARTPDIFSRNDSGWKATAADLGIHWQTLVHRLRLIQP